MISKLLCCLAVSTHGQELKEPCLGTSCSPPAAKAAGTASWAVQLAVGSWGCAQIKCPGLLSSGGEVVARAPAYTEGNSMAGGHPQTQLCCCIACYHPCRFSTGAGVSSSDALIQEHYAKEVTNTIGSVSGTLHRTLGLSMGDCFSSSRSSSCRCAASLKFWQQLLLAGAVH